MATLSAQAVRELDPYAFLAALGQRVVPPGGRASTGRLHSRADTDILDLPYPGGAFDVVVAEAVFS
jgi:hypothetical protein